MKKFIVVGLILVVVGVFVYRVRVAGTQDDSSPSVVSSNPASGASDVATNSSIHVYFSEAMDPSTITSNTFTLSGDMSSALTGEVTCTGRAAAFIPFSHMDTMATYTATIGGSVTDTAGNSLGSDYSWSFQTASE